MTSHEILLKSALEIQCEIYHKKLKNLDSLKCFIP